MADDALDAAVQQRATAGNTGAADGWMQPAGIAAAAPGETSADTAVLAKARGSVRNSNVGSAT